MGTVTVGAVTGAEMEVARVAVEMEEEKVVEKVEDDWGV